MIDPHVHLRDWNQRHKETVAHGLEVALKAGLDGVFEMPNTDPPLVSEQAIRERIELADEASRSLRRLTGPGASHLASHLSGGSTDLPIFHGIYAGITSDPYQITEIVKAYDRLFPRVVGLKLFAGHSTGNLGVISEQEQREVFRTLAKLRFRGVLAVHCEKEGLMRRDLWDPSDPASHCLVRPPEAEMESIRDVVGFAREEGFSGVLHICHVSVFESIELIEKERDRSGLHLTCGLTPHHLLLCSSHISGEEGLLLKTNPPLRSDESRRSLLRYLTEGRTTWIETDHAPHTLKEKLSGAQCPSGIPGLPIYPRLIRLLRQQGMSDRDIERVTHENIVETFGIEIPNSRRMGRLDLAGEYEFDPYRSLPDY
jgi:dihydroorotase